MGADPAAAIPGLLAAIAADHEYRPPLDRLRHLLEQHAELVGPAVPPLVGLLARPARPYRRDLLNLLADLARQLRTRCDGAADHGRPAAFAAAAPALVGMLADPDRYVRMLVPYVLCTIGGTGPGVPGALLARAARESDAPPWSACCGPPANSRRSRPPSCAAGSHRGSGTRTEPSGRP